MERVRVRCRLAALAAAATLGWLAAGCRSGAEPGQAAGRLSRADQQSAAVQEDAASARSPIVGLAAPDFTLPDQNSKAVTLSQLRGQWVVLYFYPRDDTPGCTCEATDFTNILEQLRRMNARVLGISDDSVETHRIFVEKYGLGLDLLSDKDHQVMERYGSWVQARLGDRT